MEILGLKKQQIYLMDKVKKLSDELLNVMELLELVSQIIDQDDDDSDDELEPIDSNLLKTFKYIFKKQEEEEEEDDEDLPKRKIEIETDSDNELIETYSDKN